jgi:uncharacterized cupredoxin-like copper-binding protein
MTRLITAAAPAFVAASLAASAALAAGVHGAATGEPGDAAAADRTVQVTMYDNYYEPEQITIEAGETVRFVVTNEGELVHEFNIGTAETHAEHQDEMMMMVEHGVLEADKINRDMMSMDMGGGQMMKHDDPNSVLLEPGETAEVVWRFPEDAGVDIEFACNVPGHYDAGMQGDIDLTQ